MLKNLLSKLKASFEIKDAFFICEETQFHQIVNEITNSFMVVHVVKIGNIKVSEKVIFSGLQTLSTAEKYLKTYKEALKKKNAVGAVIVVKEEL